MQDRHDRTGISISSGVKIALIVTLVLTVLLIVLAGTGLAPFIYTLF